MVDALPPSAALALHRLRGGWGQTTIVEDIDLTVQSGETVAIIGRNGVGKSTLLELIVGRANRHSGEVFLGLQKISDLAIHDRARFGLGYVPQEREVFSSLTVHEHLTIAQRPGQWNEKRVFELFPSLARRQASLGRHLSGGEQQMLSIARALVGNPRVLLMDEPSEGLAPVVVEQLVAAIQEVVRDKLLALVLVEHRVEVALELSNRCLIMDRGKLVHEESSETLKTDASRFGQLIGLQN